jgi:hypothetical protein
MAQRAGGAIFLFILMGEVLDLRVAAEKENEYIDWAWLGWVVFASFLRTGCKASKVKCRAVYPNRFRL